MNEGGKDSSGHLSPPLPVEPVPGPILSGPAGLAGIDGNADQKVGLFTRLVHLLGETHSSWGSSSRNAIDVHKKKKKKRRVIADHESHAYLANHFETV